MGLTGAVSLRRMRRPTFPGLPIGLLVASVAMIAAGICSDFGPPPPSGELLPGTVLGVEQDGVDPVGIAVVQVVTADGPVICGIYRKSFPDERVPAPQTKMTVDYGPSGCFPPPVSQQLPRWVILTMGGVGALLMSTWLWVGYRGGLPRRRRS